MRAVQAHPAGFTYELIALSESAVTVRLNAGISEEGHRYLRSLSDFLEQHRFPGWIEIVPAFTSVTVYFDPIQVWLRDSVRNKEEKAPLQVVCDWLQRHIAACPIAECPVAEQGDSLVIDVPVCYGGAHGPDLEEVAAYHGMSCEEVIGIHSGASYFVHMIGFMPGFPYLGGLSERIVTPRRRTPRLTVPPGSVGIGGSQTGIYPLATPGGWHLIGRTPLRLFQPEASVPTLLQAGDRVRFVPISAEEYRVLEAKA